jgi:fimbrial chaperone protein
MRNATSIAALAAAALLLALPLPAMADSLEVAPTTVSLDAGQAGILNIVNRGDEPITAQIEAFDWSQRNGKDELTPTNTLQVSPPMAKLAPGERQIVRVRAVPGSANIEQAYRLVVSELPSGSVNEPGAVRVLLQFKVPVFAGTSHDVPRQLNWSASAAGNDLVLRVSNDGTRHAKLAKIHVVTDAGRNLTVEPESFFYVLPGASRSWTIPDADLSAGTTLHVKGVDESDGTSVESTIVSGM